MDEDDAKEEDSNGGWMQVALTLHRRQEAAPDRFSAIVLVRSDSAHVQDFDILINFPINGTTDENLAEVRGLLTRFVGQFGSAIHNLQFTERRRTLRD